MIVRNEPDIIGGRIGALSIGVYNLHTIVDAVLSRDSGGESTENGPGSGRERREKGLRKGQERTQKRTVRLVDGFVNGRKDGISNHRVMHW